MTNKISPKFAEIIQIHTNQINRINQLLNSISFNYISLMIA